MLRVVQVVRQQQCNGHCLCDSICPSTAVETATAQCTSRWAMAWGHRLNTSIVLAAVHGLSGLFRAVSAVEPSLCRPLPTLSPSLIGHLASMDVKQHESKENQSLQWQSLENLSLSVCLSLSVSLSLSLSLSPSLSPPSSISSHSPSYVTTSRCVRNLRLKELSD